MNPVSMRAFEDELEKIAVTPNWIHKTLGGMANKVQHLPTQSKSQLNGRIMKSLGTGGVAKRYGDKAGLALKQRNVERPTSPVSQRLQGRVGRAEDKHRVLYNGLLNLREATLQSGHGI